jgi:cystathionine beta-lyase
VTLDGFHATGPARALADIPIVESDAAAAPS